LKSDDEVALMAFAKNAQLVQDFTKERRVIEDKIEAINRANGLSRRGTYLNEAVHQAASHLRAAANPTTRRVIITITDNVSSQFPFVGHSEREALYELFESGGVLCALIPSEWIGTVLRNSKKLPLPSRFLFPGSVNSFAKETGGIVLKARREEVQTKLDGLIDRLRARYSLGYVSTNPKYDGQFRRVKLKIAPNIEEREGKLVILSKRGYYASRAKSMSF
jgi:VWFA-related protein